VPLERKSHRGWYTQKSSRAQALYITHVTYSARWPWGHDWVALCILVVHPFWAPTKVFALPIAARLYRNRQGLTKGKKKGDAKAAKPKPDHKTRPELAVELITLAASWFPNDTIVVTGDSAYGGKSVLRHLPKNVHLISHVHPKGALYEPAPPPAPKAKGRPRKKGKRLPGMAAWAEDPTQPWTELAFRQFGLHAKLAVKTIQALYYKSGGDRLLTIVLVRDLEGGGPTRCSTARRWIGTRGGSWGPTPTAGRSNARLKIADSIGLQVCGF